MATELQGRLITSATDYANARITIDGTGIITSVEEIPSPTGNTPRLTWLPGFTDLHNHGGNQGAFPTGTTAECRRAAKFHRAHGTTTLLASLVSATPDDIAHQVARLAPLVEEKLIAGIHLEGPFVNAGKCGAQDPSKIMPGDPAVLERAIDASGGNIRSITFAPETANVEGLLHLCAQHNIIASLGHTLASYEVTADVIAQANSLGVTVTATHLFNAMPSIHHREPGAAAALIAASREGRAALEVIGDGVHLADGTVDLLMQGGNVQGFAITDAMEAAGMPDGSYTLGELDVTVNGGVATLANPDGSHGAIAGGTSTLLDQFHLFSRRHPSRQAVAFTSSNAFKVLARANKVADSTFVADTPGSLVGKPANLVGLTPDGRIHSVLDHRTSTFE